MASRWKKADADRPAPTRRRRRSVGLTIAEIAILAMFGAMMVTSTEVLRVLPNIHLLGLFIVTLTVVYRWRALYSIYVFVFLHGLLNGFGTWWFSYLYVWTILWGMVMLLPRRMPTRVAMVVYPLVSALHGFLFGVLCAPVQALVFHLDLPGTLVWIASGLPFDLIHGVSNLFVGLLIVPLVSLLGKLDRRLRG